MGSSQMKLDKNIILVDNSEEKVIETFEKENDKQ